MTNDTPEYKPLTDKPAHNLSLAELREAGHQPPQPGISTDPRIS